MKDSTFSHHANVLVISDTSSMATHVGLAVFDIETYLVLLTIDAPVKVIYDVEYAMKSQ